MDIKAYIPGYGVEVGRGRGYKSLMDILNINFYDTPKNHKDY